jgi:hypothetical protein
VTDLIDAVTLAQLTAINESAMEENAIIITDVTLVDDGAGSWTETTATRTVDGDFWTVSGDEAGEDQIKVKGKYRCEVPKTVAVSATARITYRGNTYVVKFPFPIGTYDTSRIIGLEDA